MHLLRPLSDAHTSPRASFDAVAGAVHCTMHRAAAIITTALRAVMMMAALMLGPVAAQGGVSVIETVGRAVATGVASPTELRRRALEEALYDAAMAGGAQVRGYSALAGAQMVAERLVVQPASRILDYAILSETKVGDVLEVRVRAHVGELAPQAACSGSRVLEIAAWEPQVSVAPDAPAWMQPVAAEAGQRLITAMADLKGVALTRMGAPAPDRPARIAAGFDYAALTGSVARRDAPPDHLSLISQIALQRLRGPDGTRLEMRATSRLLRPDGSEAARDEAVASVAMPRTSPFATLDRLATRSREALAEDLLRGLRPHVEGLIRAEACKPLTAPLAAGPEGTLTLPFGRRHGITRQHLAYTDGAQTPYTLLEVVDLAERTVTLRPIDRGRAVPELVGAPARFAEPAG